VVVYENRVASFFPEGELARDTTFTATVTQGVRSEAGLGLEADYRWSFGTGNDSE
jgi:hypothetical protein